MLYKKDHYSIFFGTGNNAVTKKELEIYTSSSIIRIPQLALPLQEMQSKHLFLQKQVHGISGKEITKSEIIRNDLLFNTEGDFLITKEKTVALGVLTADCLPIVIFDPSTPAIGIAHAGWRGSVAGIATTLLEALESAFGTTISDVSVYFGVNARLCCYEVSLPFKESLQQNKIAKACFVHKNQKIFFDTMKYNLLALLEKGVQQRMIQKKQSICTICSPHYYSYRKNKNTEKRQITAVSLK